MIYTAESNPENVKGAVLMAELMTREEALCYLRENLTNKNLVNHSVAVEKILIGLAQHFGEEQALWGLTGILHDIDYGETAKDPDRHSLLGAEMLEEKGLPAELVYAVKVHNDVHGLPRISRLDKALFAADPLSGLIVAGALIHPSKKLAPLDVPFMMKRFAEKSFAKGANRETILHCSELGLSLEEFLGIGLAAMQGASDELGL